MLPVPGSTVLNNNVWVFGDGVARTARVLRVSDVDAVVEKLMAAHPDIRSVLSPLKRPLYATEDQVRAEYDAWRADLLAQARELETLTKGLFVWHESRS